MDFRPSSACLAIRDRAWEFAQKEIAPYAAIWDREGRFPAEVLQAYARAGLVGLTVPKEKGGPGASTVAYALSIMELAKACSSTAVTVAVSSMVAEVVSIFGTKEQEEEFLRPLVRGEFVAGSFALSEPGSGSDAGSLRTAAVVEGETIRLQGEKCWISSGTDAGVFVVWARTSGEGPRGITTFLVSPKDRGFSVGRKEDKMGLRASTTVSLHFSDCVIPASRRLGEEGRGFRIAMTALDGGRIGVSSQAIGIAEAALSAVERFFATVRKPKATEKALQARLSAEVHAARLLTLRAASLKDQKRPFSAEAATAKAYSTETANRICQEAVLLLGEEGSGQEWPVERLLRDCKVTTIYEGTSEIQRVVISRHLLQSP